jgi:hypothetical protein
MSCIQCVEGFLSSDLKTFIRTAFIHAIILHFIKLLFNQLFQLFSRPVFKVLSSQLPESILEAEVNEGLVEVDGRLGLEEGDLQLQVS